MFVGTAASSRHREPIRPQARKTGFTRAPGYGVLVVAGLRLGGGTTTRRNGANVDYPAKLLADNFDTIPDPRAAGRPCAIAIEPDMTTGDRRSSQ